MPRVKIIWSNHIHIDDYTDISPFVGPSGDWEEITDEELRELRQHLHYLTNHEFRPHLLIDTGRSVRSYLEEIRIKHEAYLAGQARRQKADAAQFEKRARLARERRKAQFEKLKKEFGD